jgi:hypothetical protein
VIDSEDSEKKGPSSVPLFQRVEKTAVSCGFVRTGAGIRYCFESRMHALDFLHLLHNGYSPTQRFRYQPALL